MTTVLLADDEALVRAGLRMILESEPGLDVVAEAADGAEAVAQCRTHRPDVALLDVRMPGIDGLDAARRILAEAGLDTAVVMLTTFDSDDALLAAIEAGAAGFLLKSMPRDRLVSAVRAAASGEALLAPEITRRLMADFVRRSRAAPDTVTDTRLAALTDREREVLVLMARGASNVEIADALFLGVGTVKTHVTRVLTKLAVRGRVQAVVVAYETGLVRPRDGAPG
ncbi:two component transcriptional regulator, LuxR family [Geodermatophilus dictyosporus]|uniref:Two component transcriptional regulator, LuxR family n=1 Tax=Geodermatophilus dictyosporus TaxID=1523247 RepID=A0A1I5RFH8_9ACTN|nr:response regulator transcription factor [Geodermatophilus dictyosporus]SFP57289.1 two component transcriptional regulator, LuxR family [Geodermatophilus dictyosporus]